MAITQLQVFAVADKISSEGLAPTVALVRSRLGTGSYTTITSHLRDWKAQALPASAESPEVPQEVTEALERSASLIWGAALAHFQRDVDALRREYDLVANRMAQDLSEAVAEIDVLERDNAKTVAELSRVIKAHQAAGEALADTRVECAEWRARHSSLHEMWVKGRVPGTVTDTGLHPAVKGKPRKPSTKGAVAPSDASKPSE